MLNVSKILLPKITSIKILNFRFPFTLARNLLIIQVFALNTTKVEKKTKVERTWAKHSSYDE